MPRRPTLANLRRQCPQDLASCDGYVWHLGSRIGKGSFGEVFLGWTKDGSKEVAVKVVNKDFFKQDPKVRENLEREIRIMKLLRGCEYVVHLFHVQEMKNHIVLVMELCDYDLDKLVKTSPCKEDDITLFLYQLAQGMRALRDHNVVHRDLKPGNILIKRHPKTGKMVIKLADFGFARHFKDEGAKPIDMTSLAGTPVFMAPEALRCVFYAGEHYDDKVDIWSIGALLYKVIVGECGFFAQLQEIPKILKHKGDAIAFTRSRGTRKIIYINELPPEVNDRFSPPYRGKMNQLLCCLLKLDPAERMTFPEFFDFIDDLITSKVEVVNLLHGTSFKIIYDPNMTSEQLQSEVNSQSGIQPDSQVIFSSSYAHYLSPHTSMEPAQFSEFLQRAGGSEGHAIVYLLPMSDINDLLEPEYGCLAKLIFAVEDAVSCVDLIYEHKLTDEIVKGILYLQDQQKKQRAGLDIFSQFCSRELDQFVDQYKYKDVYQRGLQSLAKGTLALNWLMFDLDQLAATPLPQAIHNQLKEQLQLVEQQRSEIDQLTNELDRLYQASQAGVSTQYQSDVDLEDVTKSISLLSDEARKLPKTRRDYVHSKCEGILRECKIHINDVTGKVQKVLRALFVSLSGMWSMMQKVRELADKSAVLDQHLVQVVPPCRGAVFKSLASGTGAASAQVQAAAGAVVATSPGVFPRPPPSVSSYATSPVVVPSPDPALLTSEREKEKYQRMYEAKKNECKVLLDQVTSLQAKLETSSRPQRNEAEEEKTLQPHTLPKPADQGSDALSDTRVLEQLTTQLQQFCVTAEKIKPGISGAAGTPSGKSENPALYPDLMAEYSVIDLPKQEGAEASPMDSLQHLLPQANRLMSALHTNMGKMDILVQGSEGTKQSVFVKVAKPHEYETNDMVIFHPIKLQKSKSSAPILMHVDRPKPYILMDFASYGTFGIRPGRMPDLILGKLKEKPRSFRFESDPDMSKELGEATGEFFRVKAEPCHVRFARPTHSTHHHPIATSPRTGGGGHGVLGLIRRPGHGSGYV